MSFRLAVSAALGLLLAGCLSYDESAAAAVAAIGRGDEASALKWSGELAESSRSFRLGIVESGRICMLAGSNTLSEACFRRAIDAAIDHKEKDPVIKLGDVAGAAMASTVTDDWSMEYYLSPYEINLALEYGILAQLFNGRREDALVDARLAIYVQDKLGDEYGADLGKGEEEKGKSEKVSAETDRIVGEQNAALNEMIATTRNSWENPVLWWLTGVLLESDGEWDSAGQSYRRAGTTGAGNAFFERDMRRVDTGAPEPTAGRAKLVVLFEDGFVPRRAALKIPLRFYATMSIDVPTYAKVGAYSPRAITFGGPNGASPAALGLNVRSLAGRDLSEAMPGIVTRNVTRAAVNVGIEVGGRAGARAVGGDLGWMILLGAEVVNLCMVASRDADTRSWATLPDAQYVWCDGDMAPGDYQFGVTVDGITSTIPLSLTAGETKLLWIADCGSGLRYQFATIGGL